MFIVEKEIVNHKDSLVYIMVNSKDERIVVKKCFNTELYNNEVKIYKLLKGQKVIITPIDFINNTVILPYYSYTLYDLIFLFNKEKMVDNTSFNKLILILIKKIAIAINSCKQCGIIHRDIKPLNIVVKLINTNIESLCDDSIDLVLIDFGISTVVSELTEQKESYVVTRWYRAPELILKRDYSYEIDMWAFGVIVLQLLLGDYPFPGNDEDHQLELYNSFCLEVTDIVSCVNYIKNKTKLKIDFELDSLIIETVLSCLNMEPSERITVEELLAKL